MKHKIKWDLDISKFTIVERKSLYQMGGNINAGIGQNIGEQGMQYADLDGLIEHL